MMESQKKSWVVHCQQDSYDIYCGRPNNKITPKHPLDSKYHNPFPITKYRDREKSIHQFIMYALAKFSIKEIQRDLRGKILGCWCKPKHCHCDWLSDVANS